jgi:hypothetical protein
MIRTTRWRPDTCECILTYDWEGDKIIGNHVAERKCELHRSLHGKEHFDAVCAHNRANNTADG